MPPFKPYVSSAQQRFFHTDTAARKGISATDVAGKDRVSKGRSLPKRIGKRSMRRG